VYGQEVVVPLEFLVPSLHVAPITNMTERGTMQERLNKLTIMEEDMILAGFHQEVHKARDKSWHDRHIKRTYFLVYESKSLQHPGKLRMHWLGPYEVNIVTYGRAVQLKNLGGTKLRGMINGSRLKLYRDSRYPSTSKKKKKKHRAVTMSDIKR
jgi:hypothetical protein